MFVHGFTQSRSSFAPVADALADVVARRPERPGARELVSVDLPGHGDSPDPPSSDALGWAAGLLGDTGGRAVYIGYSMGARVCMRLALDRPAVVAGLVLVGATPGIDDASERAARRAADEALANEIASGPLEEFLARWLAGPLFAHLDAAQADLGSRLGNTPHGLAAALAALGPGADEPMWDRIGAIGRSGIPTLLVTGERDAKFADLARVMARRIGPNARTAVIAGAGHAAPFEQPRAFAEVLDDFLSLEHL